MWKPHAKRPCPWLGSLVLSGLQVVRQISIVVLMRTDHDQLEIASYKPIAKEILGCMYPEFVNEDTLEIAPLLLSKGGVLQDSADLSVKGPFVLLMKPPDLPSE